ncbi:MAG: dTMP kinase, partial [Collinsella sp.]
MAFEPARHSFITLEGVDGAGKSTQARLLARALELAGYRVVSLREPGGTAISERSVLCCSTPPIRRWATPAVAALRGSACPAGARGYRARPRGRQGGPVRCFYDSTTCYQAFADGLDRQMVRDANNLAVAGTHPALTLVYHITPEQAALRMAARGAADRMEAKGMAFQERVYQGFCTIAAEEPNRVKLIDATATVEEVFEKTVEQIRAYGLDIPQD